MILQCHLLVSLTLERNDIFLVYSEIYFWYISYSQQNSEKSRQTEVIRLEWNSRTYQTAQQIDSVPLRLVFNSVECTFLSQNLRCIAIDKTFRRKNGFLSIQFIAVPASFRELDGSIIQLELTTCDIRCNAQLIYM